MLSNLIGVVAVGWALLILVTSSYTVASMETVKLGALVVPLVGALQVAAGGLFVMAVGRVLAGLAEICWFSSPENPESRK